MKERYKMIVFMAFIVIFIFSAATLIAGTTGKIRGIVTEAATGEPLAGANVFLRGTLLGGATDADGLFIILRVPPGTYTIEASMVC